MRSTEFDHLNPGLVESCQGCRWRLEEAIINEGKSFACAHVDIFEGVLLQIPKLTRGGDCWDYGIPSPYDEQLTELIRGKKPGDLSKLPEGLPGGLSPELLFYASILAKYHRSKD